jgi:hypothetical protein
MTWIWDPPIGSKVLELSLSSNKSRQGVAYFEVLNLDQEQCCYVPRTERCRPELGYGSLSVFSPGRRRGGGSLYGYFVDPNAPFPLA